MSKQYKLIRCNINGKDVEKMVDVRASLTDMLRNDYHLTSVKKGCEVGECGACTVLIDGETVNACIYLAVWADGKHIRTLEGLLSPDGEPSDIQQAFMEESAIQCGFCTPGFLMTAVELVNGLGARRLMQAVDVLGDDGLQLPLPLPFRQLAVGGVGLGVQGQHFGPVEVVEFLGVRLVKCVAEHCLRRVFEFLVIQAVHTAEVRDAGFGGHAGAAEKHDVVAAVCQFLQPADGFVHTVPPFLL